MTTRSSACVLAACLMAALAACDDTGPDDEQFRATLSGPSSSATGTADFEINDDGTIGYSIDVAGLSQITMAHIHGPASATQNAGPIVWLYPVGATAPGTPTGTVNGELARGTLTVTQSQTIDMDSLRVLMRNGNSYVNIHTSAHPGGEIRGQILER